MMEKLFEIIKYHSESVFVDFKSLEYPLGKHEKRNEFLKDISAMANHPSNDPKYIFIGIKAKDGIANEYFDIETPTDQAKYQQFITENVEPKIHFDYISFDYEGRKLAVFVISNNHDRPYLFKKNVQKPTDQAVEFKEGDGFIRAGTSTRKLIRNDFEEIYIKRHEARDRQNDLRITPVLKLYSQPAIGNYIEFYIIDFIIENVSSKSVGFDVEMKLIYSKNLIFRKKFEIEEADKERGLQSIYPKHFQPRMDTSILNLNIEKKRNSISVSRNRRHAGYAINISQKDIEESVFFNEILIGRVTNLTGDCLISLELVLRSDDFKEGPLIKKYEFDLKNLLT